MFREGVFVQRITWKTQIQNVSKYRVSVFTASEAVLWTVRRLDVAPMKYRKKERRIEEKEGRIMTFEHRTCNVLGSGHVR